MIIWFFAMLFVSNCGIYCAIRLLKGKWSYKDVIFCTFVPVLCFLVWAVGWFLSPASFLPYNWFDERPTLGERAFICLPPLIASYALFAWFHRYITKEPLS